LSATCPYEKEKGVFSQSIWIWTGFNLLVLALLFLDLGVFHRKARAVSTKEAGIWTAVWVALGLLFGLVVYIWQGSQTSLEYLTGYLIEKSLSVDNIFVFVVIFSIFRVPAAYQHRVLFFGILGALVMRGALIVAGSVLLEHFHWMIYIFGGFLILIGIRMVVQNESEPNPEKNPLLRMARRVLPVTSGFERDKFFVRRGGALMATPLFLVLLVVEATDLVFAVDSIPAIFAVTRDPFIVYTSNVFAILGLRSLYFLLAGAVSKFHYLKIALSAILVFVGVKMVVADLYQVPVGVSLGIIVGILAIAVLASALRARGGTTSHHRLKTNAGATQIEAND
jgi:tellurite resistance protein TerC